jgi:hypothetical protein
MPNNISPPSSGGGTAGAHVMEVVKVSQEGIVCCSISDIEKYLDGSPNPAEALEAMLIDVDYTIQACENMGEWVSEFVELVSKNDQWLSGKTKNLREWRQSYPGIVDTAKRGKESRNKRKEDENALVALGVGGPRFEYLLRNCTRNFLHAIRNQIAWHGYSYPLVCGLANVKTYHRLVGAARGIQKTRETQPVDAQHLDSIAFRRLSATELRSTRVVVGPAGFLVPSDSITSSDQAVVDPGFDTAMAHFIEGAPGAQQPKEFARAEPKITEIDDDDAEPHARRNKPKKTYVTHPSVFPFASKCTCPEGVPGSTRTNLDKVRLDDGFGVLHGLMDDLMRYEDQLCLRHCQLVLVFGMGVQELTDKNDTAALQKQLAHDLKALMNFVVAKPMMKGGFDAYKAALGGFTWSQVRDFKKASSGQAAKRKRGE